MDVAVVHLAPRIRDTYYRPADEGLAGKALGPQCAAVLKPDIIIQSKPLGAVPRSVD
jgi:hypothetical protein